VKQTRWEDKTKEVTQKVSEGGVKPKKWVRKYRDIHKGRDKGNKIETVPDEKQEEVKGGSNTSVRHTLTSCRVIESQ